MTVHPILERQIRKYLPEGFDIDLLQPFLQAVNSRYESQERDKQLSEHAFAISEREYQDVYQNLKEQNEISRQSVEKLKCALSKLDQRFSANYDDASDLMRVVNDITTLAEQTRILKIELESAKESAEQLAKAKGNFLSVMSHEIRTPLNAIIGNIHLLEGEPYLQEQESLLRSLRISSHSLLSLINDILDFSKIDEGKVSFNERNMSLSEILHNLREAHSFKAMENRNKVQVWFDASIPPNLIGDESRLNQIMNNLIGNAIKFTQNGTISIAASLVANNPRDARVRFSVTDTGIGIENSKQSLIFERFTQANSDIDRKYGGSGLGLTIVKRLLELWGSKIELQSEPGQGSTFQFELEFRKGTSASQRLTKAAGGDLSGVRILVVEDTEYNVKVAERMLTHWKATVDVAVNGQVAVDKCKTSTYDAILMDIQMPVMDGITATRTIRMFNQQVPIIAVSASAAEVHDDVVAAGMSDSVAKPFNPHDFFDVVFKWTRTGT
ncbi:MAG: ATP-binding protein [Cyclobacteriaceae bacterium]